MKKLSEIRDKKCPDFSTGRFVEVNELAEKGFKSGFDTGVAEYSKLLRAKVEKDIDDLTKLSSEDYGYNEALDMCRAFLEYIEECK